jgi:hypothetical protein
MITMARAANIPLTAIFFAEPFLMHPPSYAFIIPFPRKIASGQLTATEIFGIVKVERKG